MPINSRLFTNYFISTICVNQYVNPVQLAQYSWFHNEILQKQTQGTSVCSYFWSTHLVLAQIITATSFMPWHSLWGLPVTIDYFVSSHYAPSLGYYTDKKRETSLRDYGIYQLLIWESYECWEVRQWLMIGQNTLHPSSWEHTLTNIDYPFIQSSYASPVQHHC